MGNSHGKPGTAFLDFDSSQKAYVLQLKEKQVIRFTGAIRSFGANPLLERCKLLSPIKLCVTLAGVSVSDVQQATLMVATNDSQRGALTRNDAKLRRP